MGGFDPVRDSASASPIGPPRFDPVRDSMAPSPRQESRREPWSESGRDSRMADRTRREGWRPDMIDGRRGSAMGFSDKRPSFVDQMDHDVQSTSDTYRDPLCRDTGEYFRSERRSSRSASIADMLNDSEPIRTGSSGGRHDRPPSGHAAFSNSRYATGALPVTALPAPHGQSPYPPVLSPGFAGTMSSPSGTSSMPPPHHNPYHLQGEDGWHARTSPTTPLHHSRLPVISSPHMPPAHMSFHPGSMMPPSPMQEPPRSRYHDLATHEEVYMAQLHNQSSQLSQRSPSTHTLPAPIAHGIKRNSSSASISSIEQASSYPSPHLHSSMMERSPSLQSILNEAGDERRPLSSRSSADLDRQMGPPITPGSSQPNPLPVSPGTTISSTESLKHTKAHSDLLRATRDSPPTASDGNGVTKSSTAKGGRKSGPSSAEGGPSLARDQSSASFVEKSTAEQTIERPTPSKIPGRKTKKVKANTPPQIPEQDVLASAPSPSLDVKKEETAPLRLKSEASGQMEESSTQTLSRYQAAIDTRLAYKPAHRVSVPTVVRIPITTSEADRLQQSCRNPLRHAWQRSREGVSDGWDIVRTGLSEAEQSSQRLSNGNGVAGKKRKNSNTPSRDELGERGDRANNNNLVAAHYNARQDAGLGVRNQSPILPLRNFNNWLKSVLISRYVVRGGRALDLGGGKGGDLPKWDKGRIGELVLADIAEVSVAQAHDRYRERRYRFNAHFYALDCFGEELAAHIPREILSPLFDIVSLQFCLHYGWENVSKAQLMLENVARYLKPGGHFVGTIPDSSFLKARLSQARREEPTSTSFGNSFYRVVFDGDGLKANAGSDELDFAMFGQRYTFTLLDAVDGVAEYVVDWPQLESLALQNGMQCVFKRNFSEMWSEDRQSDQHRDVARRMGVPTDRTIPMDAELWEACSLYVAFAFEKRSN